MDLSFESEASTDLVRGLIRFLGIERSAKAESDAWSELDVVRESSNTSVVDLSLNRKTYQHYSREKSREGE